MVPIPIICIAILIRWLVGYFPHSGQERPPMYGDYEAQRHWMEITVNIPVKDWYRNTTDNDLLYWGLDYPPLTAYHMFTLGQVAKMINSSWVELHKSRGVESYEHKIFMRSSVLLVDVAIYMSAIVYYFYKTPAFKIISSPTNVHKYNVAIYTAFVLMYPGQILIDHGHFQYNCFFMGLTLWAINLLCTGKKYEAFSALLFTLALGYKQMSLYYSLPFFWYLASSNLRRKPIWKGLLNIMFLGLIVCSTFGLIFLPYLSNINEVSQVIKRLFPFDRGVFEDKVANVWFSLSIFYKFRNLYTTEKLIQISTILTLATSLPGGIHLLWRPTTKGFKYALATTSLAFYLLSYQVHEKTILVPALPILLLIREHPKAVNWFSLISTFSLQPLLLKDGQTVPFCVLMICFTIMSLECFRGHLTMSSRMFTLKNLEVTLHLTSILGCYVLGALALFLKPPARYPDINPTMNSFYSCAHFIGFLLFFYFQQFKSDSKSPIQPGRMHLIKKNK